ncbi:MAG: methionine--tRNA ligase subunit beta, partial [Pseudomonadota bacterium]
VAAGGDAAATWAASHHVIAKDILRFHAVYWPAMLKSAGLPPPKSIFCHGYLTVKGQKISKSLPATKVDPNVIAEDLGVDPLRYFLLREYSFGGDGDFTYEALLQRYESDLGNDLGNLLNRTVSMARQYLGGVVPAWDDPESNANLASEGTIVANHWETFQPSLALDYVWSFVRNTNAHIEREKPWAVSKELKSTEALLPILAFCCGWLRVIAKMISPAMPDTARNILQQLGLPSKEWGEMTWPTSSQSGGFWPGNSVPMETPVPLFPRLDPERKAALLAKWLPPESAPKSTPAVPRPVKAGASSPAAAAPEASPAPIDKVDFDRVELRAAKVIACERVPKTEKLLKLTLDIGTEQRTVVSGIAAAYAPEALVGRTVVYLANLKPAKIRGVVSQGMILAAGDADVLALTALDRDVPPGTQIR